MPGKNASDAVRLLTPRRAHVHRICPYLPQTFNMCRAFVVIVAIACLTQAASRPVRRTLNFNMFVLQPNNNKPAATDRILLTTNGLNRFGPIFEYLVQRVQGMMSVKLPQDHAENSELPVSVKNGELPLADAAENEVDGVQPSKVPGVVVRPSRTKPGTYEVEINVLVDDGQPDDKKPN